MEATGVIPGETEEELFRLRNVRLGEKGFLPFDQAVGVYQPLRQGELTTRGEKVIHPPSPDSSRFPVPLFAATLLDGDNLFVRALKSISEGHIIQQFQVELASLCNQVISADQEVIRGRDQLKSVVSKVSGYLSIGLALMTENTIGCRETSASELLKRHLLADIFRTGFARALQLKWQATRWRKESWCQVQQLDLTFWEEEWLGLLGGLLIDKPKCFDPSNTGSNYRDFQTLEEIEKTSRGLDQVMAMDQLFKALDVSMAPVEGFRLVTYKNLLLTLWARASLNAPPIHSVTSNISISLSAFRDFYTALWTVKEDDRIIGNGKKTDFLKWAATASGQATTDLSDRLGTVFEALFDEIERDLAHVQANNLDPRYIHLFLLKP
jgi:hypothetical protein